MWRVHAGAGGEIGVGKVRRMIGCRPVGDGNVVRKAEPDVEGSG